MKRFKNISVLFAFSLLSLLALRFVLFVIYFEDFAVLSLYETFLSFLNGIRIDIIVLCGAFALPSLLLFLPCPVVAFRKVQLGIYMILFILISVVVAFIVADILYFEHVHRHITGELFVIQDDLPILLDLALLYIDKIVYFVLFELVLFFVFKRVVDFDISPSFSLKNVALFLGVLSLLFLGIRSRN